MSVTAIVFSRDRPLQLDACLRSLRFHVAEPVNVRVLWRATTPAFRRAYQGLFERDHDGRDGDAMAARRHGSRDREEREFELDMREELSAAAEHTLFVVDDTLFVRAFSLRYVEQRMNYHIDAIGFSLRLGGNTHTCYPLGREQQIPVSRWQLDAKEVETWPWFGADGDFGYPLEISSSVYRTRDVCALLEGQHFGEPNALESELARGAYAYAATRHRMMAFPISVAFSLPINRVQAACVNRSGAFAEHTPEALLEAWEDGWRVRVEAYAGRVPTGAHEEAPLILERVAMAARRQGSRDERRPCESR